MINKLKALLFETNQFAKTKLTIKMPALKWMGALLIVGLITLILLTPEEIPKPEVTQRDEPEEEITFNVLTPKKENIADLKNKKTKKTRKRRSSKKPSWVNYKTYPVGAIFPVKLIHGLDTRVLPSKVLLKMDPKVAIIENNILLKEIVWEGIAKQAKNSPLISVRIINAHFPNGKRIRSIGKMLSLNKDSGMESEWHSPPTNWSPIIKSGSSSFLAGMAETWKDKKDGKEIPSFKNALINGVQTTALKTADSTLSETDNRKEGFGKIKAEVPLFVLLQKPIRIPILAASKKWGFKYEN